MAVIWRLKSKQDRRFRSGHPWVYSNELAESPKGIEPGEPVELRDAGGAFLARGYGNPASLIAFRAVSRDETEKAPLSGEGIFARLQSASRLRERLGLAQVSHRLVFGEADLLPGLIIDAYALSSSGSKPTWAYVVQAHAAGMDRVLPSVFEALARLKPGAGIVERNDVGVRKLEGLEETEPRVVAGDEASMKRAALFVRSASGGEPLVFKADLVGGQKTGFFLDQARNVELAVDLLVGSARPPTSPIKILDLCSYVGQWGGQLSRAITRAGGKAHVTAVDASPGALELARENVRSQGGEVEIVKGDVMEDLGSLATASFDLVIADPPALIKGRKHLKPGMHGYLQLNTQAVRLLKDEGAIVSCSCSALLPEDEFLSVLAKASRRGVAARSEKTGRSSRMLWIGQGGQGPDHPISPDFPEGRYLKCRIGVLNG